MLFIQNIIEIDEWMVIGKSGFRHNRSTDNLLMFTVAIHMPFSERNHMVAVFFNLAKAYDITWRYGILLQQLRLRGNHLSLLNVVFSGLAIFSSHLGPWKMIYLRVPHWVFRDCHLLSNCQIDPHVGRCAFVDDSAIYFSSPHFSRQLLNHWSVMHNYKMI